jgi:hypothetical protein
MPLLTYLLDLGVFVQLTADQAQIINDLDPQIDLAFTSGVINDLSALIVTPIQSYTTLSTDNRQVLRNPFDAYWSAFIFDMNIAAELPVTTVTGTATLPKLTTTTGHITFSNGFATVYSPPS